MTAGDLRVLTNDSWEAGFVPYHLHDGEVQIEVTAWIRLAPVVDMYIVPERDIGRVLAYVRRVGLRQTVRKVTSRVKERGRNEKYVVFGLGRVASGASREPVMFFAPAHPRAVDTIVLPQALVRPLVPGAIVPDDDQIRHGSMAVEPEIWAPLEGWSPHSGEELDTAALDRAFGRLIAEVQGRSILDRLERAPAERGRRGEAGSGMASEPAATRPSSGRKRAVLFGYGHYAKNIILPRITPVLDLACIHEIDPVQLGRRTTHPCRLSTAARLEPSEGPYDAYFIAGFHHTHAPIAAEAVRGGAAAVIEKPLATTRTQLETLLEAARQGGGRLFACYQRRYSVFNDFLRADLQITSGTPVSVRSLVFEIPLPRHHWYLWPNSGSRLLSNGCHWIDYFLFLNRYCRPVSIGTRIQKNGDHVVLMDLENGASFSMTLSEHGSPRFGVRDHLEIVVGSRQAVIEDESRYVAESRARLLRRRSTSKMDAYNRMYTAVAEAIAHGRSGDDLEATRISAEAVLTAEEQIRGRRLPTR